MIQKILKKDILVKVCAVVLALAMWVTAAGENNPEVTRPVTVSIKAEAPAGRTAELTGPDQVTVTLRGRTRILDQIAGDKQAALVAVADMSKAIQGKTSNVPVSFTPPAGLTIVDMTPKTVPVFMDSPSDKKVAVEVRSTGTPNEDYEADKPSASVPTVTVSGPSSIVDRVQAVYGVVDVNGAVGAVTTLVPLVARDSAGNEVADVTVTPSEIQVTVPMKSLGPAKVVPLKLDLAGVPLAGYRVNQEKTAVTPSSVRIRGEASAIRSINSISTRQVDLTGRNASFNTTVSLAVPAGVTVEGASTKVAVNVEIEEDIIVKTFPGIPIIPEGKPVDCTASVDPARVDVTLSGRSDLIAGLKASDIQAYVDASSVVLPADLAAGQSYTTPSLQVLLRGTDGLRVDNISSAIVRLILTKR